MKNPKIISYLPLKNIGIVLIDWPTQHTTNSDYYNARKKCWWTFLHLQVLKENFGSDFIGLDKISPQETFIVFVCI